MFVKWANSFFFFNFKCNICFLFFPILILQIEAYEAVSRGRATWARILQIEAVKAVVIALAMQSRAPLMEMAISKALLMLLKRSFKARLKSSNSLPFLRDGLITSGDKPNHDTIYFEIFSLLGCGFFEPFERCCAFDS